ncbi:MAG: hypothetical protein ACLVJO_15370 [[Clostridium] scindens]
MMRQSVDDKGLIRLPEAIAQEIALYVKNILRLYRGPAGITGK